MWDDDEELQRIPYLVKALRKKLKVFDVGGLRQASASRLSSAFAEVLTEEEMPGVINMILKYLGSVGHPHIPPGKMQTPVLCCAVCA